MDHSISKLGTGLFYVSCWIRSIKQGSLSFVVPQGATGTLMAAWKKISMEHSGNRQGDGIGMLEKYPFTGRDIGSGEQKTETKQGSVVKYVALFGREMSHKSKHNGMNETDPPRPDYLHNRKQVFHHLLSICLLFTISSANTGIYCN